jgi:hypothetical protein
VSALWIAASFALSVVFAWALVRAALGPGRRGWSDPLFRFSLAAGLGMGISSLVYFWARLAFGPSVIAPLAGEILLAAGLIVLSRRRAAAPALDAPPLRFAGLWILAPLVVVCALAAGALFVESTRAAPHGEWDAWGIWNVRAKFMAENSPAWTRAFRPPATASARFGGAMHPEYPPMLPASIARLWSYAGGERTLVPALVAGVFTFALLGLLTGALALLRGPAAGLAGALVLLGSASVLDQGTFQYADIPLAFFLAASIAAALLAARYGDTALALSGVAAGLCAWTKNEGLVLAAAFGLAAAIALRKRAVWWLSGVAPGLLGALCFKLFLAAPDPFLASPSLAAKLSDPARYGIILRGFWRYFMELGDGIAHPAVALMLLAAGLGFSIDAKSLRAWMAGAATLVAAAAGYFAAYVLSPFELEWHVSTSMGRLVTQLWPAAILLTIAALRPAADAAPAVAAPKAPRRQKRAG